MESTLRKLLPLLLLVSVVCAGCAAPWGKRKDNLLSDGVAGAIDTVVPSQPKNEQVARTKYETGQRLYAEQKYTAARASFEEAADALQNSPLQEDAMYMLAESYFQEKRFPEAFNSYDALLNKYKRSRHLDRAVKRQFDIGQRWEKRHFESPEFFLTPNLRDRERPFNDTLGRARKAFTNVRLNHPTGDLADDSLMATANSYFVREKFRDADYYYNQLRSEYPNSDHQYEAHLLGVQAKIRRYQGPDYDGTPLKEAKELIEQTARQFGNVMSPEDRKRLDSMYGKVMTGLAQREYHMAKYYERKGYYGAARQYHQQVKHEYGDTVFAKQSDERLVEVQDKPTEPPPRFTWLSSLFPENEKALLVPPDASTVPTETVDLE